eukprot:sb/3477237/
MSCCKALLSVYLLLIFLPAVPPSNNRSNQRHHQQQIYERYGHGQYIRQFVLPGPSCRGDQRQVYRQHHVKHHLHSRPVHPACVIPGAPVRGDTSPSPPPLVQLGGSVRYN